MTYNPVAPPPDPGTAPWWTVPSHYSPVDPFAHYAPPPRRSGLAVASLVLGLVGMPLSLFSIVPALALIFGYIARSRIDASAGTQSGRELAGAGIAFGWIGMAIAVVWLGVFLAW